VALLNSYVQHIGNRRTGKQERRNVENIGGSVTLAARAHTAKELGELNPVQREKNIHLYGF